MEAFLVYVVSWNVATKFPDEKEDLLELLGLKPEKTSKSSYITIPDMYVVGFQEVNSQPLNRVWEALFEDAWSGLVKNTLVRYGLVHIQTLRLQGLVLSLYIKRSHLLQVQDIECLWTRRGLGGFWGNKGAVSISLKINRCSYCFVNSHLAAHDHMIKERIEDYQGILTTQEFADEQISNIFYHDYVFWFGDLNFRLNGEMSGQKIAEMVSMNEIDSLLEYDQLRHVMKTGEAFSELQEMNITFPPTFKFDEGRNSYDLKRRPAWTDRILYQVNSKAYAPAATLTIKPSNYRSHTFYRTGDHRPISCLFETVTFKPILQKFIEFGNIDFWRIREPNSITFKRSSFFDLQEDHIIVIYKANFSSLDESITYLNARGSDLSAITPIVPDVLPLPTDSDSPTMNNIVFPENCINFPGQYVLLYMSKSRRSVYSISSTFEAIDQEDS